MHYENEQSISGVGLGGENKYVVKMSNPVSGVDLGGENTTILIVF